MIAAGSPIDAIVWSCAIARSTAFAAFVPLLGSGAVPRTTRAALALALAPAVAVHLSLSNALAGEAIVAAAIANACEGAIFGIAATIIASAASAAGSLFDAALAANAITRDPVFGAASGPFARIFGLLFAIAFLDGGGFMHLCWGFVRSAPIGPAWNAHDVASLAGAALACSLTLAAPAIAAQIIGTFIAAAAARAAPRINGLMLSSPIVTLVLGAAAIASLPAIARGIEALAVRTAGTAGI